MTRTDYGDSFNWASLGGDRAHPVDLFHLLPTSWYGKNDEVLSRIEDPHYRQMAEFNLNFQASVFDTVANIYAPHYRQLEPYYCLNLSPEERMKIEEKEPKQDVFDALDYYFEHYNNGKPFILSGHSQGSILLLPVLSQYMKAHPERYERMIGAYVIGYSVTDVFLKENPHLRFAQNASDTGVIISYNTQSPDLPKGENPLVLPGAQVINPITWSRGEEKAGRERSLGSKICGTDTPHYADAQIDKDKGCLICSTADAPALKSGLFKEGIFHIHDYGLYYYDLRANAALRTSEYMNKSGNFRKKV